MTTNPEYPILIADYNSRGIQKEAEKEGITHMREIGRARCGGDSGPLYVLFALPHMGSEIRVLDTNADPVWEEDDPQLFAEGLESLGLD